MLGVSRAEAKTLADGALATVGLPATEDSYRGLYSAVVSVVESTGVDPVELLTCVADGPQMELSQAMAGCAVVLTS